MGAGKAILIIAGLLLLGLSWGASYAVDYLDEAIHEGCEDEQGMIAEAVGLDEGQCQDARDWRHQAFTYGPMLGYLGAALLLTSVIMMVIRKRQ